MARQLKQNIYVIQKWVRANSLTDALKKEKKGEIVNVTIAIGEQGKGVVEAIGFRLWPDGKENIDYED